MATPILSDPDIAPTNEIILSYLGKAGPAFISLFEYNHTAHPDVEDIWKFYNDGKRWLFHAARKKKTLFWLSIDEEFFRVTFYYPKSAARCIAESRIPEELKMQYKKTAGKTFRGITHIVKTKKDLAAYKELLALKISVK